MKEISLSCRDQNENEGIKLNNRNEVRSLIDRYRSITRDEVDLFGSADGIGIIPPGLWIANKLTGFGQMETCTLCRAVGDDCALCFYGYRRGCSAGDSKKTYDDIRDAKSADELLAAFKARAAYIESLAAGKNKYY